jgi:hypothetical protein
VKKGILLLFILLNTQLFATDIKDQLINTNFCKMIRLNRSQYICTLFVRDDIFNCIYESDAGSSPSILGYRFINTSLELIIKSRWQINDWNYESEDRPTYYYYIILQLEGEEISYSCSLIDTIDISGFIILPAFINDDDVNIRREPNLSSEVIEQFDESHPISVLGISRSTQKINEYTDYWFEIDIDGQTAWVFGYLIDFQRQIDLRN